MSRNRTPLPKVPVSVMAAWLVVLLALLGVLPLVGCGACDSGPRIKGRSAYARYGGLSKEEWLRRQAEREKQEQAEAEAERAESERLEKEAAERQAAQAAAVAPPAEAATTVTSATSPPPAASAPPPAPADSSAGAGPSPGEYPPLLPPPVEYEGWSRHDFLIARIANDPQLLTALGELRASSLAAGRAVGPASDVTLLRMLLSPRVLADLRDGRSWRDRGKPPEGMPPAEVIKAVVPIVGLNAGDEATQTLAGLISGEFETEDDRVAAEAALEALIANPSEGRNELVCRAIAAAELLRPAGRGVVTAQELRQKALELARPAASVSLRSRMAELMASAITNPEIRALLGQVLLETNPANLEAHIILYRSDVLDAEQRAQLITHFTSYSSEALGYFLGFPAQRMAISDPQWPLRVANHLWNDAFRAALERRHEEARSLAEVANPFVMAATVPLDVARDRIYLTLLRHWEDGPATLGQLTEGLVTDPGLLVLLKSFDRRVAKGRALDRPATGRVSPKLLEQQGEWVKHKQRMAKEWYKVVASLSRLNCERFSAAARMHAAAMPLESSLLTPEGLPLRLHDNARVMAGYKVVWPGSGEGQATTPPVSDRLAVYYVRVEEKTAPQPLLAFYRRQVKERDEHGRTEGVWIDSFEESERVGIWRSTDIYISRVKLDQVVPPDEAQELTVEILVVEAAVPSGKSESTAAALPDVRRSQ